MMFSHDDYMDSVVNMMSMINQLSYRIQNEKKGCDLDLDDPNIIDSEIVREEIIEE